MTLTKQDAELQINDILRRLEKDQDCVVKELRIRHVDTSSFGDDNVAFKRCADVTYVRRGRWLS